MKNYLARAWDYVETHAIVVLLIMSVLVASSLSTAGYLFVHQYTGVKDKQESTHDLVVKVSKLQQSQIILTTSTTRALCSFKSDLQQRVSGTEDYLLHHPEGFAGIPYKTIQQTLANQQSTLDSLKDLKCPPPALTSK